MATTYQDNGHTLDTGGIDTGNCPPTTTDPQWGHESLGWRLVSDSCGEGCPTNQLGPAANTSGIGSTSSTVASSTNAPGAYVLLVVAAILVAVVGYFGLWRRRPG